MASWTINLLDQNKGWLWVFFIRFVSPCIFDNTNNPEGGCNYFITGPRHTYHTIALLFSQNIYLTLGYLLSVSSQCSQINRPECNWIPLVFLTQEFSHWTYSIEQLKKVNSSKKKNKVKLRHITVKKLTKETWQRQLWLKQWPLPCLEDVTLQWR